MQEPIEVCGIPFCRETMAQCLQYLVCAMENRRQVIVHTANARALVLAKQEKMRELFSSCDLVIPDGDGVLLAARLQYKKAVLPQKIAGIDLLWQLLRRCEAYHFRVFFFGGKEGVAEQAAARLRTALPRLEVCGTWHGYLKDGENEQLLQAIARTKPHLLVVCLGMPRQEEWMRENKDRLAGIVMGGFGGSLDVFAGKVKRAPRWVQKIHAEWLYRVLCQPRRMARLRGYPSLYASILCKRKSSPMVGKAEEQK